MKADSYWIDTAPAFDGGASGPVPARADAVVIGGGYTGLAAARALAMAGARVVVLEAGRAAHAASGRNGGQCNNGLAQDFGSMAGAYGLDRARAFYRDFDDAVTTVETLVRDEGIDCDFSQGGKLKLAAKPEHVAKLEASAELLRREVDADVTFLDAAETRREVASDTFHGALLFRRSASMHVGRFGAGLAAAAARRGAQVFENAFVSRLEPLGGGRYRVTSTRGVVDAERVLIATGASEKGPFGWFRRRIVPIGSFIVATEPLPGDMRRRILPGARTCTTTRLIGNFFRTTPDDRLIFGGRARFALPGPRDDAKSGIVLRRAMVGMFPELAQTRIDYCWGGVVDMSADRLPHAGRHEGLFFATGFSGHGTQMSVHLGAAMAAAMLGTRSDVVWDQGRWPAITGHYGKPWFLPAVGAWYRIKDALS
ncbi:FAD-binding oxidoreductase [Gluconacetobacter azotocaptans]|uniref:FAD-binding oxidoreductase n=1 Tax=Gluconacetobacter azotocaptans TaxID=142834 RepID=A0A7W4PF25_9PROT|nr:FAD-binding oxidoreductase [Gluconacetobacter azotocaptans]MBB2188461.1 FAD-binding oxidoreductase [Gluconacetobacter azotocaptans]GBQ27898.1 FAD dependent oxidoreductase [Gluconacetobacter azotocaptans DSM 13594]